MKAMGHESTETHHFVAITGSNPKITVGRRQISDWLRSPVQAAAREAWQIQAITGGLEVVPRPFGFPSIDADHEELFLAQPPKKVLGKGGVILTSEKDMFQSQLLLFCAAAHLVQELVCASAGVVHREGASDQIADAVTEQRRVLGLGVIQGYAHDFGRMPCLFEDSQQKRIAI
jgi:hypothetical protein